MDILGDLLKEAKDTGILEEKRVANPLETPYIARRVVSAESRVKKNVAIVLILDKICCENCGSSFEGPNAYPHVRQVFPSGMTQVTPYAMTEKIDHLPREVLTRETRVPVCQICLDSIELDRLRKASEFRIRENYGVHKYADSLTKAEHNNRLSDATFIFGENEHE